MRIGISIQEAIDWTQDQLVTTRPLAERTLFVMLAKHRVTETETGYMLAEDADEDEPRKVHQKLKTVHKPMNHRPRSHVMQKKVALKYSHDVTKKLQKGVDVPTEAEQKRIDLLRDQQNALRQSIASGGKAKR